MRMTFMDCPLKPIYLDFQSLVVIFFACMTTLLAWQNTIDRFSSKYWASSPSGIFVIDHFWLVINRIFANSAARVALKRKSRHYSIFLCRFYAVIWWKFNLSCMVLKVIWSFWLDIKNWHLGANINTTSLNPFSAKIASLETLGVHVDESAPVVDLEKKDEEHAEVFLSVYFICLFVCFLIVLKTIFGLLETSQT